MEPVSETAPLLGSTDRVQPNSNDPTGDGDQKLQGTSGGGSIIGIISILLIGVFVSQADVCLVLATYGKIASEFQALDQGGWLLTSYMLAQSAAQPLYGKLSDIFGRKRCLQTSYVLFATGTLCSGFARSMPQIIASRALEGCGGAGMVCMVSILLTDLVPLHKVAVYRSYVNVVQTSGRSCGAVIGGIMAQTMGWRWPFLLQCPLVLGGALLVEFKLKINAEKKHPASDLRQKLKRIDFAGAFFLSTTILGALAVLDLGGQKLPWSHPVVIGAGCAALICSIGFIITEKYFAAEPIFPLRLITHYVVCTSYLMLTLQNLAIMAMMFVVPMYYQVFKHASTGEAGGYLVLSTAGNTIAGLLTGWYIGRTRRYKFPLILGSLCSVCGFLCLIFLWRGQTDLLRALFIFPVGFATGVAHSAIFIGLSHGVDSEDIAIAGSGLYLSSNVGMVTGVSLGNAVFQLGLSRGLQSALQEFPHKDTVIRKILADLTYVQGLTGKLRSLVLPVYVLSFERVFIVGLVASGLCLFASIFSKEKPLTART